MTNIEMLKLNKNTLTYYRNRVKGNKGISEDQANKKISRNRQLSLCYKEDPVTKMHPRKWYAYGALRFMVQNNEVKWIENNCAPFPMWYQDWDKYIRLSKELGIESRYIKESYSPKEDVKPDELSKTLLNKKKNWFQRLFNL